MKLKIIMSVAFLALAGGCAPFPYQQPLPGKPYQPSYQSKTIVYQRLKPSIPSVHVETRHHLEIVDGKVIDRFPHEIIMLNRYNEAYREFHKQRYSQHKHHARENPRIEGRPFIHKRMKKDDDEIILKRYYF